MTSNCSLRLSYIFTTTFYILQHSPHSTLYANLKWYSRREEKKATNRFFSLGIEYKIILEVQHLWANAEYLKNMNITNSPFIASHALVVTYLIARLGLLA